MKNIFILTINDFLCTLRNKSFYLVFFIPAFLFVTFHVLDRNHSDFNKIKIGLKIKSTYSPKIIKALQLAKKNIELAWVNDANQGETFLKEHQVHGLLEESKGGGKDQLALVVLNKDSPQTLAIVEILSRLQNTVEKNNPRWITEVRSVREGQIQKQTLPTWILMVVLLVAFIILPAQVAEEKEKKLILALLQTPIHEAQWIAAKILLGLFLALISILLLQIFSEVMPVHFFAYIGFILVGSYCFSAFGIFLGFMCRNQASARTLGVVFYLPLIVPAALSDFSQKMKGFLPFIPSTQFYEPLQTIIFEEVGSTHLIFSWLYLFLVGSGFSWLSYWLMKKRWLM